MLSQLIAVEIPMLIIVLRQLQVAPRTLAGRLAAPALATLLMALACLLARASVLPLVSAPAIRAGIVVAVGALVYAAALWRFAPDVWERAAGLVRHGIAATRRRRAISPA